MKPTLDKRGASQAGLPNCCLPGIAGGSCRRYLMSGFGDLLFVPLCFTWSHRVSVGPTQLCHFFKSHRVSLTWSLSLSQVSPSLVISHITKSIYYVMSLVNR